eukprot:CAMPEP_0116137534 /NCGR_PEP_ID=MMETSP0329-20121206/12296_1 /TAXON_ID=697910 /ORGANISM="Pseudo-nitzschia arenysensis, Strain B593" /LENGTH=428 /DNA_ID=CAMNT_0003632449 /DNA_START=111 /DNA_END=1397 /DNA_ORIENTATION=-
MQNRIKGSLILVVISIVLWAEQASLAGAFVQTTLSPGSKINDINSRSFTTSTSSKLPEPSCLSRCNGRNAIDRNTRQSTQLFSFLGSDGGIFGIGTPELFTIVLIGYFVLGPSDLYKLVKEIGKFIQNFQTFATEATATLENNMESQLQLEEIRKTQRELNDAFSFRRSINVEAESDPFVVNAQSPRGEDEIMAQPVGETEYDLSTGATAGAAVAPKKKKMRRVKRKKKVATETEELADAANNNVAFGANTTPEQLANDIPSELGIDDEMLQAENKAMESILNGGSSDDLKLEENDASNLAAQIREDRIDRLERAQAGNNDEAASIVDQSRFQQQLSGDWNDQILANNEKLEPLAEVMNLLAVLEEEKIAADKRLQEEFEARELNEEKFYLEKRKVLEEAAASVQAQAYAGNLPATAPSTANDNSSRE